MAGAPGSGPRVTRRQRRPARRGDLNGWWRFGVLVVGFVWRLLFRTRVEGAERVPQSGPAIVAANHVSGMDGVALAFVTGRHARRMTRFLVAAEFFDKLSIGWALRLYRQIPLQRGQGDRPAIEEALATIRAGALAGIFPEGSVNPDPIAGVQRGRRGVARIALATGAPVVPVGMWGTQGRWPKSGLHMRRPWRPVFAVAYGEPIAPDGDPDTADDLQVFAEQIMTAIGKQADQARALAEL
jgi:1-acyl-sn-glycerol-3-phosphate acyltransferase